MKPVIKKQTHYNLLLMKDDSQARTFRLHGTTLKVLLTLFLLLLLGGGAGIAGGVHFFKEYLRLASLNESQDKELSEMRLQLERLVNLECLIVASNGSVPLAKNEEVGVTAPQRSAASEGAAEGEQALSDAPESANGESSGQAAEPAADAVAGAMQAVTEPSASAAGQQETTAPQTAADTATPGYLSLGSETSPLSVNGFQTRITGRERLRISYELATTPSDEPRTVSGSVRYRALLKDGSAADLTTNDIEGTRFAIARMKPMQNSVRLPQGQLAEDVEKIEVLVELTDGTVYQDVFGIAD